MDWQPISPACIGRMMALACAILVAPVSAGAQFTPNDVVISDPSVDINDPEFDQANNRLVWQENDGSNLWVAWVDPVTGDMTPTNGKGQLVDTGLVPMGDSLNGPEWAYDVNGKVHIVYSKLHNNIWSLGVARDNGRGGWAASLVNQPFSSTRLNRWRPFGTVAGNPTHARMAYLYQDGPDQILAWRYIGAPNSEMKLPGAKIGARFIDGLDSFVTTMSVNGVNQVIQVDAATGQYQQLTFDTDTGNRNGPFMWFAPDVGPAGEYVFMVMLGTTGIGVYREKNGVWSPYSKINFPTSKEYISSPEPFVYNGKSYIFAVVAGQLGTSGNFLYQPIGATEVWIAGINPIAPFYRRVDDPNGDHHRVDPEVYYTVNDAMIYYTQRDYGETNSVLRRAATGLGPLISSSTAKK